MTYGEQLKDPRWQQLRLRIMERDSWTCQECSAKNITLHVHHRRYVRGRAPWEYEPDDLVTLCEDCHAEVTREMDEIKSLVGRLSIPRLRAVRSYLAVTLCDGGFVPIDDDLYCAIGAAHALGDEGHATSIRSRAKAAGGIVVMSAEDGRRDRELAALGTDEAVA